MVETRTSGGDMVLWLRQGPVEETWSCGRDKDQRGDRVLW